jgi:2-aminoadipate transaminase
MNIQQLLSQNAKNLKPSVVRALLGLVQQGDIISFAGGMPDPEIFPKELFAQLSDKVIREQGQLVLQYGMTIGWQPLREQIVAQMAEKGITCSLENVIITAGSQQGLDLAARALLDPGDLVVVEEPTFLAALLTFRNYGARFLCLPAREDGLDPEELDALLTSHKGPRPKFLYTVPSFQNPAGSTMPNDARRRLVEVCRKHDLVILEDDPYGELNYSAGPLSKLKNFDSDGRVVYLGSFSKIGSPGMRLGWAVADPALVAKMTMAKETVDVSASVLAQAIAAEFFKGGHMPGQVRRYVEVYSKRRDVMMEVVQKEFPKGTKVNRPKGGFFLWPQLPEAIDAVALFPKAVEAKVAYVIGPPFFATEGKGKNCLRMAFCSVPEDKIRQGVAVLGQVFNQALDKA